MSLTLHSEHKWYDFEFESHPAASMMELGQAPAPGGGLFGATGTLLEVIDPVPGLVEAGANLEETARVLAATYSSFLRPPEEDNFPAPADSRRPRSRPQSPVRLLLVGEDGTEIDCKAVRDDVISLATSGSPRAPPRPAAPALARYDVRLRFCRPGAGEGEGSLLHLTFFYHPYDEGGETRPQALGDAAVYDLGPGDLVSARCGRMLHASGKPCKMHFKAFSDNCKRDESLPDAARKAREKEVKRLQRCLRRAVGVLSCDSSWLPTTNKSGLAPNSLLTKALAALNEDTPERELIKLGGVTVFMMARSSIEPKSNLDWGPHDGSVLRDRFLKHTATCTELDKETVRHRCAGFAFF